jgi:predicted 3-demethylubiquinone-9 3-methyltransferase (glyoxalase superfamily)
MSQKITPFLWFDNQAEEAMNFYVDVFKGSPSGQGKDSEVVSINRYPTGITEGPMAGMDGKVLTGVFKLAGQTFMCLDGGPIFKFSTAQSFYVECQDQAEIDYFWEKLSAVPEAEQCGWLADKYGLPWQIIPKNMKELMTKNQAAMQAMLQMKKIVIADLENAK